MRPETIADLTPAPYNPRTISGEALAGLKTSVREFGDISGIVYNTRSGHLVCGHQRLEALKQSHELQLDTAGDGCAVVTDMGNRFPVRLVDWDEATDYQRIVRCFRGDLLYEYDRESGERVEVELHRFPMLSERGDCDSWDRFIDDRSHYWSLRISEIDDLSLGTGHIMDGFSTQQ